jgi:hypothetical protein
MLIDDRENNPNRNKAFIYTEECKLCGKAKKYSDIIQQFSNNNIECHVRQISLYDGWKREAQMLSEKLDLKMPFVWFFNTRKGKTISEAKENGIDDLLK